MFPIFYLQFNDPSLPATLQTLLGSQKLATLIPDKTADSSRVEVRIWLCIFQTVKMIRVINTHLYFLSIIHFSYCLLRISYIIISFYFSIIIISHIILIISLPPAQYSPFITPWIVLSYKSPTVAKNAVL